ncbi:hypothetical protein C5U48_02730 [Mycolicibacter virginiensis]|uniref:Uncharacterized protein n=2 Tax=Mycolicibacter virginiensis TaxID=1795032 RepID=A0A9X7P070_9MYCO|nr:hypothetical protein C5U48_02730 [Mycolicibacter virginiensis]
MVGAPGIAGSIDRRIAKHPRWGSRSGSGPAAAFEKEHPLHGGHSSGSVAPPEHNRTHAPVSAAIRSALAAVSPAELARFDAELSAASADTAAVLGRWALRLHPLSPEEEAALERARGGDCTGFLTRDGDGRWIRL